MKYIIKTFLEDTEALKISSFIKEGTSVQIAGYPLSRNDLLIKKGTVSRLEYNPYSLSNENLLILELNIDAKAGNSGGPILNKNGKLIGIAMQIPKTTTNKAYAVPSYIINGFLKDIEDKKVDGFHSNSNSYQYMENKGLQEYYKTNRSGILVTGIDIDEKQLKVNDILLKVDKKDIEKDRLLFEAFIKKMLGMLLA